MKRFALLTVLLLISASVYAQLGGSSAYVGMAMPRKGYTSGLVLGYKYQYDLPVYGLGVIGTVDFTLNRPNKDARAVEDKLFNDWLKYNGYDEPESEVKRRKPVDFSLPVNFGVNYSYTFGRITPFAEAAIGFATMFRSPVVWKADESHSVTYESTTAQGRPITVHNSGKNHYYTTTKYTPAVTFSYKFGIGAMLDYRFSLGVEVDGVSKYKQKSVSTDDIKPYWNTNKGSEINTRKSEQPVKGYAYVAIRLGYYF